MHLVVWHGTKNSCSVLGIALKILGIDVCPDVLYSTSGVHQMYCIVHLEYTRCTTMMYYQMYYHVHQMYYTDVCTMYYTDVCTMYYTDVCTMYYTDVSTMYTRCTIQMCVLYILYQMCVLPYMVVHTYIWCCTIQYIWRIGVTYNYYSTSDVHLEYTSGVSRCTTMMYYQMYYHVHQMYYQMYYHVHQMVVHIHVHHMVVHIHMVLYYTIHMVYWCHIQLL